MNANVFWILVASSTDAKIFATEKLSNDWQLVKEFHHPESKETDVELVADKFGSYPNIGTSGSSSFTEQTDPKETEVETFARQLAEELNLGRSKNLFHKLIIVAPPKFLGILNKHSDSHVLNLIIAHLEKDYTKLKDYELMPRIREQIKSPQ